MLEVSDLVPEARPIARAAAEAIMSHTQPWFVGLMAHGSAYKGGFILGCSDVDMQLYLEQSAFAADGQLPLDLCVALHRDLARIDPTPFGYIQIRALPSVASPDQVGPIPGAYTVIAGRMPLPEATEQQLRDAARAALARLRPVPAYLPDGLLNHGMGRLARQTRWLCADVWPTLYHVLALRTGDALGVWRLPRGRAIALLPEDEALGGAIRTFYAAVRAHYPAEAAADGALAVIEAGVVFLRAAKTWWESDPRPV
jgi:hypothetical protein